jgi:hypothetical protein
MVRMNNKATVAGFATGLASWIWASIFSEQLASQLLQDTLLNCSSASMPQKEEPPPSSAVVPQKKEPPPSSAAVPQKKEPPPSSAAVPQKEEPPSAPPNRSVSLRRVEVQFRSWFSRRTMPPDVRQ